MKKNVSIGLLVISIIIFFMTTTVFATDEVTSDYDTVLKQDILTLMMAYPEYIKGVEKAEGGKVYIITVSGKKILYDDKIKKDFNQKMDNADIQDVLEESYPLSMPQKLTELESDPGRFRCYELLNEVYGKNEGEVSSNLTIVPAPYNGYQFNKRNGAAESLKAAMVELKEIAKTNNKVAALISPVNGTFNYRVISGTGKLSPHAYGIAIDINSNPSDYWKWATREAGEKRMMSYPKELVETFENHNFVWGGKWGHFDILHFEYRPEIIIKAKYFSDDVDSSKEWFGSVERTEEVNRYIELIENSLGV